MPYTKMATLFFATEVIAIFKYKPLVAILKKDTAMLSQYLQNTFC